MMTKREAFPEELYYGFSLEDKVPDDHLLRRIKECVDFSFVYGLVDKHYSHTGAPSIDPVVVFKLSLIGYLYDISSERRLIEEASLNMAYLWFIDYKITENLPDHSIFTKTRARFGVDAYREFFKRVVKTCVDAGLVEGQTAFLDATLIDANSRVSDVRSKVLVDRLNNSTDEFVQRIFEENKDDTHDEPKLPSKANKRLSHPSDPDADIVRRENTSAKLKYKGHIALDGGEQRIITAVALTGGAMGEEHLLLNLLSQHEELIGKPETLVADQKYGTATNLRILKVKGILPAVKPYGGRKPPPGFTKDKFKYDEVNDRYICPNDKVLSKSLDISPYKSYRAKKADCPSCPLRLECTPTRNRKTLTRGPSEYIFSWARGFLDTDRAKELLRMRGVWPETIFAQAKNLHGLSRARFRGRWKVEIQMLLTASVINLKKLARQTGKTGGAALQKGLFGRIVNKLMSLNPRSESALSWRLATAPKSRPDPRPCPSLNRQKFAQYFVDHF